MASHVDDEDLGDKISRCFRSLAIMEVLSDESIKIASASLAANEDPTTVRDRLQGLHNFYVESRQEIKHCIGGLSSSPNRNDAPSELLCDIDSKYTSLSALLLEDEGSDDDNDERSKEKMTIEFVHKSLVTEKKGDYQHRGQEMKHCIGDLLSSPKTNEAPSEPLCDIDSKYASLSAILFEDEGSDDDDDGQSKKKMTVELVRKSKLVGKKCDYQELGCHKPSHRNNRKFDTSEGICKNGNGDHLKGTVASSRAVKMHWCKICSIACATRKRLSMHMKKHHQGLRCQF